MSRFLRPDIAVSNVARKRTVYDVNVPGLDTVGSNNISIKRFENIGLKKLQITSRLKKTAFQQNKCIDFLTTSSHGKQHPFVSLNFSNSNQNCKPFASKHQTQWMYKQSSTPNINSNGLKYLQNKINNRWGENVNTKPSVFSRTLPSSSQPYTSVPYLHRPKTQGYVSLSNPHTSDNHSAIPCNKDSHHCFSTDKNSNGSQFLTRDRKTKHYQPRKIDPAFQHVIFTTFPKPGQDIESSHNQRPFIKSNINFSSTIPRHNEYNNYSSMNCSYSRSNLPENYRLPSSRRLQNASDQENDITSSDSTLSFNHRRYLMENNSSIYNHDGRRNGTKLDDPVSPKYGRKTREEMYSSVLSREDREVNSLNRLPIATKRNSLHLPGQSDRGYARQEEPSRLQSPNSTEGIVERLSYRRNQTATNKQLPTSTAPKIDYGVTGRPNNLFNTGLQLSTDISNTERLNTDISRPRKRDLVSPEQSRIRQSLKIMSSFGQERSKPKTSALSNCLAKQESILDQGLTERTDVDLLKGIKNGNQNKIGEGYDKLTSKVGERVDYHLRSRYSEPPDSSDPGSPATKQDDIPAYERRYLQKQQLGSRNEDSYSTYVSRHNSSVEPIYDSRQKTQDISTQPRETQQDKQTNKFTETRSNSPRHSLTLRSSLGLSERLPRYQGTNDSMPKYGNETDRTSNRTTTSNRLDERRDPVDDDRYQRTRRTATGVTQHSASGNGNSQDVSEKDTYNSTRPMRYEQNNQISQNNTRSAGTVDSFQHNQRRPLTSLPTDNQSPYKTVNGLNTPNNPSTRNQNQYTNYDQTQTSQSRQVCNPISYRTSQPVSQNPNIQRQVPYTNSERPVERGFQSQNVHKNENTEQQNKSYSNNPNNSLQQATENFQPRPNHQSPQNGADFPTQSYNHPQHDPDRMLRLDPNSRPNIGSDPKPHPNPAQCHPYQNHAKYVNEFGNPQLTANMQALNCERSLGQVPNANNYQPQNYQQQPQEQSKNYPRQYEQGQQYQSVQQPQQQQIGLQQNHQIQYQSQQQPQIQQQQLHHQRQQQCWSQPQHQEYQPNHNLTDYDQQTAVNQHQNYNNYYVSTIKNNQIIKENEVHRDRRRITSSSETPNYQPPDIFFHPTNQSPVKSKKINNSLANHRRASSKKGSHSFTLHLHTKPSKPRINPSQIQPQQNKKQTLSPNESFPLTSKYYRLQHHTHLDRDGTLRRNPSFVVCRPPGKPRLDRYEDDVNNVSSNYNNVNYKILRAGKKTPKSSSYDFEVPWKREKERRTDGVIPILAKRMEKLGAISGVGTSISTALEVNQIEDPKKKYIYVKQYHNVTDEKDNVGGGIKLL